MEAFDRIGASPLNYPKPEVAKKVSPETVSSEDLCMDVEEVKELFYMMRGIDVDPESKKKDHWA